MARKIGDSGQVAVLNFCQIKRLVRKPQTVEDPPVLSYQTNMWFQLKTFLTSILLLIALCFGANAKQAGQETWIDIGATVVEVGPGVVAAIKGGEFLGKLDFSKPLAKTQAPSVNYTSPGGVAANNASVAEKGATNRTLDFAETGSRTHLRRTVDVDGQTVQINSGHGYNRPHSGGDVRDSGLSMNQIDNAIANDIARNTSNIPQIPQVSSNTININDGAGVAMTYY